MESQDTATLFLLKVWPALEANKNRIIGGLVGIVLLVLLVLFLSWHKAQNEINAGQAYSDLAVAASETTTPAQIADQYFKIASDYAGTQTAQRAQIQGAATLFSTGRYPDAQAQFQKFVDSYPGSVLMCSALIGVASCLEAQGKLADAATAYKNVVDTYTDPASNLPAKFALARISEQQGKTADALKYYEEVARVAASSGLGQQAGLKVMELKSLMPAQPSVMAAPPATMPPMVAPAAK